MVGKPVGHVGNLSGSGVVVIHSPKLSVALLKGPLMASPVPALGWTVAFVSTFSDGYDSYRLIRRCVTNERIQHMPDATVCQQILSVNF